jgi:subtilisin family serine protease
MGNENETLVAYVTMKTSKKGLSVHKDIRKLSLSTIDDFRPKSDHVDQVVRILTQAGFKIVARTAIGVSFSGQKKLFESEFKVKIRRKEIALKEKDRPHRKVAFYESSKEFMINTKLEKFAESVHLSSPAVFFHSANPPVPNPPYYYLNVLNDIPILLKVNSLHAAGITGAGVRVSMVDTGFLTRNKEKHVSTGANYVTVDHPVRDVQEVWDPNHTRNYYTGGHFSGNTITLGTPLPRAATNVEVVYSSLHPHYLSQYYNIDDIRTIDDINPPDTIGLDVNTDEYGHGTAMAANVLAVAPGCTFSFVKCDGFPAGDQLFRSFPLAGFMSAVQSQHPHIITCSWGVFSTADQNAVTHQAVDALARGIIVGFATGNKGCDENSADGKTISHPDLISVGGAFPIDPNDGGGFRASSFANSYDSVIYTNPQRHCPDVVGLVGESNLPAALIMLPTQQNCILDCIFSNPNRPYPDGDNLQPDDGWVVTSGTSAATPQVAGVAALLLQKYPGLSPMSVKNILENSARDIEGGASASGDCAVSGWDKATGFGLIDGKLAVDYLDNNQFTPFIRNGLENKRKLRALTDLRPWHSPDIIVRSEQVDAPLDELGQTVKHCFDLCDKVKSAQDNYIYLRVQNRGTLTGDCTASVYLTHPGMFSNPAAWTKIGQLNIQKLKPGEFKVADPLIWPSGLVPANGQYYIIAILDSLGSPAPDLTTLHSPNDFIKMVRKNRIAGRNITVADVIP